jgi:hypothetical protein
MLQEEKKRRREVSWSVKEIICVMDQVEGHPQKKHKSDGSASKGRHLKKKHR